MERAAATLAFAATSFEDLAENGSAPPATHGTTLNGSQDTADEYYSDEEIEALESEGLDAALGALLVLGNGFIMAAVARRWAREGAPLGLKAAPCMLVLHLALTDLLAGALSILFVLAREVPALTDAMVASHGACLAPMLLAQTVGNASAATIVAIAVDRWLAVECAVRYRDCVRPSRALVIMAVIWLVSFLFAAPIFFLSAWHPADGCAVDAVFQEAALWTTILLVSGALLACYVRIHVVTVRTLRRGPAAVVWASGSLRARSGARPDGAPGPRPHGPLGTKAARVLLLILAWDAFSYTPYLIITLLGVGGVEVKEWIVYLCTSFMKLTFVGDPFIYAANNPLTKKAMIDFVKCCAGGPRRPHPRFSHRDSIAVIEARKRHRTHTLSTVISDSIERISIEGRS